jgi:hypothetical protein
VNIPESVTNIGDWAFNKCTGLTSPVYNAHCFAYMPTSYQGDYTIPNGIKQIAGYAFWECSSLNSVTIPESVTSIGNGEFGICFSLTSITSLAEVPPTLGNEYVFYNLPTSITLYVPCKSLTAYQADAGWSYFTNIQCISEEDTAVDDIQTSTTNCQKIFRDGQLLIIRDGVEYNMQGVELLDND